MEQVQRRGCLGWLESRKGRTDAVKMMTGMRGSGKTVLMRQFMRRLTDAGADEGEIAYIDFESEEASGIADAEALIDAVVGMRARRPKYVFLDEVQRVPGWEAAADRLRTGLGADVYAAASCRPPADPSRPAAGRMELRVLPLSFPEFLELHPGDRGERFMQYVMRGSIPAADPDADAAFVADYLEGLFYTAMVDDALTRPGPVDGAAMNRVAAHLLSGIGEAASRSRIATALGIDCRKAGRCVGSLLDAHLLIRVGRRDARSGRPLKTLERYYASDTGVRNAVLGAKRPDGDGGRLLENVVCLELLRRGFSVSAGRCGGAEVDFVAERGGEVRCYQVVAASAPSGPELEGALRPLRAACGRSKAVLSLDPTPARLPGGVEHMNVIDWLLDDGQRRGCGALCARMSRT